MQLPYAENALEPFIDTETVKIHHDKHHATYVANLNKALAPYPALKEKKICELLQNISDLPCEIQTSVRNHGGGVWNHNFYWEILTSDNKGAMPTGALAKCIDTAFGSFNTFKEELIKVAVGHFGSGWGWLVLTPDSSLKVKSTSNQDCPLSVGEFPILTIDVWEHAYYLKYQNRRAEYVQNIWNLFNWELISERFARKVAGCCCGK